MPDIDKAIELRLAGVTYEAIANRLGFRDRAHAYKEITNALGSRPTETAEQLRDRELATLDRLQTRLWARGVGGDSAAIDQILRLMDRRAKLTGIEAPQKQQIAVEDAKVTPIDEARRRREARLKKASNQDG